MKLLCHDFCDRLAALFKAARDDLIISSPFVSDTGIHLAKKSLTKHFRKSGYLRFITNFSPQNLSFGSTNPDSIRSLVALIEKSQITHLDCLHAKVYVADDHTAIITSGNLTAGGLYRNQEYGIEIQDHDLVKKIRMDVVGIATLGVILDPIQLDNICAMATRLRAQFDDEIDQRNSKLQSAIQESFRQTENLLVSAHLAGGALHTVFARTILYLLEKHGPLRTVDLHPLISTIHPNLCDDTEDRIIDGMHFGKKWKHAVRTAQQQLKRNNLVQFDGSRWHSFAAPKKSKF